MPTSRKRALGDVAFCSEFEETNQNFARRFTKIFWCVEISSAGVKWNLMTWNTRMFILNVFALCSSCDAVLSGCVYRMECMNEIFWQNRRKTKNKKKKIYIKNFLIHIYFFVWRCKEKMYQGKIVSLQCSFVWFLCKDSYIILFNLHILGPFKHLEDKMVEWRAAWF